MHVQYWYLLMSDSVFAQNAEIENERQFIASCESHVAEISYEILLEVCGSKLQGNVLEDISDTLIESTMHLDSSGIFCKKSQAEFKHCMLIKCKEVLPYILECMERSAGS